MGVVFGLAHDRVRARVYPIDQGGKIDRLLQQADGTHGVRVEEKIVRRQLRRKDRGRTVEAEIFYFCGLRLVGIVGHVGFGFGNRGLKAYDRVAMRVLPMNALLRT